MKFRIASIGAALGTALISLMYLVNNIIPIAENLGLVAFRGAAVVVFTTIVPSLVWTVFFLACWRARAPHPPRAVVWLTLALAIAVPNLYLASQQWSYFSFLALDSYTYLLSGVLLPLSWAVLLVRMSIAGDASLRGIAFVALVLTVLAGAEEVYGSGIALLNVLNGALTSAWDYDPFQAFWRLLATPAIRILYWFTQALFLLALRGRF